MRLEHSAKLLSEFSFLRAEWTTDIHRHAENPTLADPASLDLRTTAMKNLHLSLADKPCTGRLSILGLVGGPVDKLIWEWVWWESGCSPLRTLSDVR